MAPPAGQPAREA